MTTRSVILGLATLAIAPLYAQNPLTFNIGGGITTPLNPTAQFANTSGNFVTSAGYRINGKHSNFGEYMWSALGLALPLASPTQNGSSIRRLATTTPSTPGPRLRWFQSHSGSDSTRAPLSSPRRSCA